MKRSNFLPKLSAFLLTSVFTLSVAFMQEFGTFYAFLHDERIQQFTAAVIEFGTSDSF